jgi:DNA topoisomerase IB
MDCIKLKASAKQMKQLPESKNLQDGRKIFASYSFNKGLIYIKSSKMKHKNK